MQETQQTEVDQAQDEMIQQAVDYPFIDSHKLEAFDRNPTGLLIELANSRKWRLLFTQFEQTAVEGKNMFSTSVVINGKKFPARCASQKKQARKDASLLALKLSYFKTSPELRPTQPDGQPTILAPEQEIEIAQALGLSADDVAEADANYLPYEEYGNEDIYGGYAEDYGQAYGGFNNPNFTSFEGQATYDDQGNVVDQDNGQTFPIPQYGTKPPPVGQRRKRRGGAGGGGGDAVPVPKKVKKESGPKSPVGALLEYAQKSQVTVKFEVVSESGPPHKPSFVMAAVVGDRTFPSVVCSGKKSGRAEAALIALRMLTAEGLFTCSNVDLWPVKPEVKKESEGDITMASETPGVPETITGSLPPVKNGEKVKNLTSESFALIHKHPISALMEYAQQRHMKALIETVSERGPSHDSVFVLAARVGERLFPSVECKKKKFGRLMAADKALRTLIAEGEYISQLATGPAELSTITEDMTHFDKVAALSHQTFNSLIGELAQNIPGRKVLASITMKQGESDLGTVIAVGSGNRCISGEQLSLEGTTVNDSHAEVVTRRSFLRYLYKKLQGYEPNKEDQLFEPSVTGKTRSPQPGKLRVKEGVTFHLYISTAPCGDGALFSPRDASFIKQAAEADLESREHKPIFSSEVQGLLRTKVEGGEGTIPVDNDLIPQTWDGLQRGERLRTMSCTDKICRWNVVGIQGALLSHFIEPIYLDSVTIGFLYDHGHLARALCCRLTQGDSPIQALLPMGYRLNHPLLGRVTVCKPPRDTFKTRSLSLNWCLGDSNSEVIDGTLGMCRQKPDEEFPQFSRLCKNQLFDQFKTLCTKFGKKKLFNPKNYADAKLKATEYQNAKKQLFKVLQKNKFGTWVCKPAEEELFV